MLCMLVASGVLNRLNGSEDFILSVGVETFNNELDFIKRDFGSRIGVFIGDGI